MAPTPTKMERLKRVLTRDDGDDDDNELLTTGIFFADAPSVFLGVAIHEDDPSTGLDSPLAIVERRTTGA